MAVLNALQEEADDERLQWRVFSMQCFQEAYDELEPDYPSSLIREPNPEYHP